MRFSTSAAIQPPIGVVKPVLRRLTMLAGSGRELMANESVRRAYLGL